jgi:hypothetical protein
MSISSDRSRLAEASGVEGSILIITENLVSSVFGGKLWSFGMVGLIGHGIK